MYVAHCLVSGISTFIYSQPYSRRDLKESRKTVSTSRLPWSSISAFYFIAFGKPRKGPLPHIWRRTLTRPSHVATITRKPEIRSHTPFHLEQQLRREDERPRDVRST